ncbi:FAS1-like dehydratase domain-containing protein [Leekyejoonella antrihumi]|uniref:Mesaconyl-C4 CoA hydratase n=1 Tax=Leekyejoonella antrihumi TaxID=1660198 RepID=A0A563DXJ7_9MICO|nr:MaoC family dehydratase N-terminal domain-containing protein [Leekyejoonella antrihumi]TWP34947.1 mesaconyl-C4 CoA hydratase [Leekyejoonella antrihumi]
MSALTDEKASRCEVIAAEPTLAMAGLLDIDPPIDDRVPELWHWLYLLDRRPTRELGEDGHPTSGIPAPPGPGRRRMFAGGRVDTLQRLRIGVEATRTSWVTDTTEKQGRSGPLTFVTVRHEIVQGGDLVIAEEQDIVYRAPGTAALVVDETDESPQGREAELVLSVDEALLFRFSALTYNAHRIHYDRRWVAHEGYADLVVHGPLQALMMGELARRCGIALTGSRFAYRLVSPMVGPQPIHVYAAESGLRDGAQVCTAGGRPTAIGTISSLDD